MRYSSPMVNIYTDDLAASLSFYGGLLGFEESFRAPDDDEPDHVELRLDGVTIALSTAVAARRVHGLDAAPGSHGFELVLWTGDVDAAYDALVAASVVTHTPPHDVENDNRTAVVRDPDGNLVVLVMKRANRPGGAVSASASSRDPDE